MHAREVNPMKRVLAIQSHVVSGYVGNKCATFPLQLHGFDVDPVMSVHFSNHTGYPTVKGTVMDGEQLDATMDGLEANGLLQHSHVLTGYIGSVSFLQRVVTALDRVQRSNPDVLYVCDPVLGDDGRLYVPEDLVAVYRATIVPRAHVLTPNQFELEQLTGTPVRNMDEVLQACDDLHERGVTTVVVTSTSLGAQEVLTIVGSTRAPQDDSPAKFAIDVPKMRAAFTGTGDLMAALLLAHLNRAPKRVAHAVEQTVASVQAVLCNTLEHAGDEAGDGAEGAAGMREKELRLIQSSDELLQADVTCRARDLT